ncbi:MAG: hypothetical protein LBG21_01150 [Campylobacteraceae bacterium]|jgi:hypothetical protein|nr:hypothetical protein [Campylobacteraceae bacterium]
MGEDTREIIENIKNSSALIKKIEKLEKELDNDKKALKIKEMKLYKLHEQLKANLSKVKE